MQKIVCMMTTLFFIQNGLTCALLKYNKKEKYVLFGQSIFSIENVKIQWPMDERQRQHMT